MRLFYTTGIYFTNLVLHIIALFNNKIKLGVTGRKQTFQILEDSITKNQKTIWMHCASLGEFEQGKPVLQALKSKFPKQQIIVSFFSPSGYENKKHTNNADIVVYLPLDTKQNAKRFLDIINPELILFVKYEIWPNILLEAKKRNLKSLLISATFRKKQSFFKWYGRFMKKALFTFDHIFTQDETSKQLIESIGYTDVSISGDTRLDRVYQQLQIDNTVDFIENFKNNETCIVFGSSWAADDVLFIPFINNSTRYKFIIAPHNIKPSYIESLKKQLKVKTVCFSEIEDKNLSEYQVFILDTIGYLTKVYNYADIAYVGGAAGNTGLHNTLEAAVFGIPIIIGKNYEKFPEAKKMIKTGGMTSIITKEEFNTTLLNLLENENLRKDKGFKNELFVKENKGAVIQILDYIRTLKN